MPKFRVVAEVYVEAQDYEDALNTLQLQLLYIMDKLTGGHGGYEEQNLKGKIFASEYGDSEQVLWTSYEQS